MTDKITAHKNKEKTKDCTLSDLFNACKWLVNSGQSVTFDYIWINGRLSIKVYRSGSYMFTISKLESGYRLNLNELLVLGGDGYMSYEVTSKDKEFKDIESLFNVCMNKKNAQERYKAAVKHRQAVLNDAVYHITR